ncbi:MULTISPECIES: ABC transporter ATP-binding protein [Rhizobium]|uniref:ATP-binding cassette domain-containing protein n=1 Tax=Rhizobium rhododendri TaxID=2506430 RepID=A0ABY8ID17_9HYPH|nr:MULTISPECIES: oligopeptide/dipeptide ABC transporter ATP-binding protein [Rhizobium]MBZ5758750.1 ATP-binding cassette domain-containing protein [Rhizobium sp. VS19-DR96]MBZ5764420.1 ATP-binding cassette domain-containing protein [Rhizobium sp. VS19-DR129.2]MBZ5771963.1 ATP-binding cassette domain-containing protein [Rhizobium sp. VS19-DRK62.2]MBZ5783350.1 ATP-binding cassette domain-containing protein [Rhizobium sp. VS19-DR121]MBZ5800798.1 ATP-binding cassette domain-containing protein [Rhi
MAEQTLLKVEHLTTQFEIPSKSFFKPATMLTAVNDVSFELKAGRTLGIVGESGCGKSTLGRSILRLIHAQKGRILWQGKSLLDLSSEEMRAARRDMQIIFQDPIASLDPRMTVGDIIAEPLTVFEPKLSRAERQDRVREIMAAVGLVPEMINRYSHEFSGGQAQRIGIARAVVTRPKLIICDEPVSALDVSIQGQVISLLRKLRKEFGLTLIFISHDLSVVRLISDDVLVLYLGRIVEAGDCATVFQRPAHPYTQALFSAAPVPDPKVARTRKRIRLQGDPPSPMNPPPGCVFEPRCWKATDICRTAMPATEPVRPGQTAACYHMDSPEN